MMAHFSAQADEMSAEASSPLPRGEPTDMLGQALVATRCLAALRAPAHLLRSHPFMVPTDEGRLAPLSHLVSHPQAASSYEPWDGAGALPPTLRTELAEEEPGNIAGSDTHTSSSEEGHLFLHPRIVMEDAAQLGIPSLQEFIHDNAEHSQVLQGPSLSELEEVHRIAEAVAVLPLPLPDDLYSGSTTGGDTHTTSDAGSSAGLTPEGGACPLLQLPVWVVRNVMEAADLLGCSRVQVGIDFTPYGCSRLLSPELSVAQGPALVITLKDVVIKAADISQMLCAADGKQPRSVRQPQGLGLRSIFALTDVPCILSGAHLCIFDARGDVLQAQAAATTLATDAGDATSVGKAFNFTTSTVMLRYCADQFRPFAALNVDSRSGQAGATASYPVDSTIIRLPLRTGSGLLPRHSTLCCEPRVAANSLSALVTIAAPMLLTCANLVEFAVSHTEAAGAAATPPFLSWTAVVHSGPDDDSRRAVLATSQWGGEWSWRGTRYTPVTTAFSAIVLVKTASEKSWSEQWAVHQALAQDDARALSQETPFRERGLVPFVGVLLRWAPDVGTAVKGGTSALQGSAVTDAPSLASAPAHAEARGTPDNVAAAAGLVHGAATRHTSGFLEAARGLHFNADGLLIRLALPVTTQGAFLAQRSGVVSHLVSTEEISGEETVDMLHSGMPWPAAQSLRWNLFLRQTLARVYVQSLAVVARQVNVRRGHLSHYYSYFPGAEPVGPGKAEAAQLASMPSAIDAVAPLVDGFYKEAQKEKLFFHTSGKLVKTGDGLILSQAVQPALRKYIAESFPDCLEMPLRVAERLTRSDTGTRAGLAFPPRTLVCPSPLFGDDLSFHCTFSFLDWLTSDFSHRPTDCAAPPFPSQAPQAEQNLSCHSGRTPKPFEV
jgi:hypothetical protein